MKKLIAHTNITDSQLNAVIGGREMGLMAAHLGNTDIIVFLEYKHWNVQDAFQVYGIQEALFVALRLWREANPGGATYRALVEIVLIKGRTDLAIQLCKFAALKCEHYLATTCTYVFTVDQCMVTGTESYPNFQAFSFLFQLFIQLVKYTILSLLPPFIVL